MSNIINIVFNEGNVVRSLKGEIVEENDKYTVIKTLTKKYRIFNKYVVKITEHLEGE